MMLTLAYGISFLSLLSNIIAMMSDDRQTTCEARMAATVLRSAAAICFGEYGLSAIYCVLTVAMLITCQDFGRLRPYAVILCWGGLALSAAAGGTLLHVPLMIAAAWLLHQIFCRGRSLVPDSIAYAVLGAASFLAGDYITAACLAFHVVITLLTGVVPGAHS